MFSPIATALSSVSEICKDNSWRRYKNKKMVSFIMNIVFASIQYICANVQDSDRCID